MPQQKRRHLLTAETNFKCCKFYRGQIKLLLMLGMSFIASPFASLTNIWSPLSLPFEGGAIVVHRKVFFPLWMATNKGSMRFLQTSQERNESSTTHFIMTLISKNTGGTQLTF